MNIVKSEENQPIKMKKISRNILQPHRYIYKHFYSTSNDKKGAKINLELSDILTDEEIEFEVSEKKILP